MGVNSPIVLDELMDSMPACKWAIYTVLDFLLYLLASSLYILKILFNSTLLLWYMHFYYAHVGYACEYFFLIAAYCRWGDPPTNLQTTLYLRISQGCALTSVSILVSINLI